MKRLNKVIFILEKTLIDLGVLILNLYKIIQVCSHYIR